MQQQVGMNTLESKTSPKITLVSIYLNFSTIVGAAIVALTDRLSCIYNDCQPWQHGKI
jgi:hypothetical protein